MYNYSDTKCRKDPLHKHRHLKMITERRALFLETSHGRCHPAAPPSPASCGSPSLRRPPS
uniref:Uncharacterized protein n=1 Tax=Arundo donax TaxID=35708 RepID=A0A0A8ZJ66_ARUDO